MLSSCPAVLVYTIDRIVGEVLVGRTSFTRASRVGVGNVVLGYAPELLLHWANRRTLYLFQTTVVYASLQV